VYQHLITRFFIFLFAHSVAFIHTVIIKSDQVILYVSTVEHFASYLQNDILYGWKLQATL
jgi:hypothetical protein